MLLYLIKWAVAWRNEWNFLSLSEQKYLTGIFEKPQ